MQVSKHYASMVENEVKINKLLDKLSRLRREGRSSHSDRHRAGTVRNIKKKIKDLHICSLRRESFIRMVYADDIVMPDNLEL